MIRHKKLNCGISVT